MKQKLLAAGLFLMACIAAAQSPDPRFGRKQLEEDLDFIHSQLFNAHANPFTEIDSLQYEALFARARQSLADSMTAFELLRIVRPLFAPLSDEHARVSVDVSNLQVGKVPLLLPFGLRKTGNVYTVETLLHKGTVLHEGDTLRFIEGIPISEIVERCANFTTGFPEQRREKAMRQLGLTYIFAYPLRNEYRIATARRAFVLSGVGYDVWKTHLNAGNKTSDCKDLISYQRIDRTGYINFCSFSVGSDSMFNVLEQRMDDIFTRIKADKVENIVIDVHRNSGGNSACGNLIINYFSNKKYRSYGCRWKRSNEYLALQQSWGINNDFYKQYKPGSTIVFDGQYQKPEKRLKNRFKGKVYVVVGPETFSSAIMFATIVKDNRLATLVGQIPDNGHPNHFGEMYGSKTPNARLNLQFGVKEWIRPSGKREDNVLRPDKYIDLNGAEDARVLVERILR